jgi:hypothetical protein
MRFGVQAEWARNQLQINHQSAINSPKSANIETGCLLRLGVSADSIRV